MALSQFPTWVNLQTQMQFHKLFRRVAPVLTERPLNTAGNVHCFCSPLLSPEGSLAFNQGNWALQERISQIFRGLMDTGNTYSRRTKVRIGAYGGQEVHEALAHIHLTVGPWIHSTGEIHILQEWACAGNPARLLLTGSTLGETRPLRTVVDPEVWLQGLSANDAPCSGRAEASLVMSFRLQT